MSGGKGGSSTSEVTIPEYIEEAARRNLNKAEGISQIGYTPYYGPDVAAFTPMQQAAFQNTANTANAFGMSAPTSQRDIMGGMAAPTEYAGGVRGYSSAPMYEESVAELGRQRPGQKEYIDSFFIDPRTGTAGSNMQPMIDYTQFNTMAQDARNESSANRANELAIANANASAGPSSVYYDYNNETYNTSNPANTYITNPAAGITDTSPASTLGGIGSDVSEAIIGNTIGLINPTYETGAINNPIANPSVSEMIEAAPSGMDYNPSTGGYVANPSSGSVSSSPRPPTKGEMETNGGYTSIADMFDGGGAGASGDTFEGGVSAVSNVVATPVGSSNNDDDDDKGGGGGCVVATHAVESGAFTPNMKREAVVWCMNVLHGKWWGEAIRRGYRHCGNKKIAQGKAREHYSEFRRYIAFARGKDRTLRGAITFTFRTAQFFAVGLVKKDA